MNATEFKPGMEGVFYDLPAETYHAAPGLSHSMTRHLEPPARLPVYMLEKREPTTAMILGTLVHSRILEPNKALPRIAVKPEGMKFSTTDGKKWRDDNKHKLILTCDEWGTLDGCVKSVSTHPTCRQLFSKGRSEVSLFVRNKDGVLFKARMDFVPDGNALADIKTCQDEQAGPDKFSKLLFDERYYTQATWYLTLWNQLHPGEQKTHFVFVAVEKKAPYLVALHYLCDKQGCGGETLQAGREQNDKDVKTWTECTRNNAWPGYAEQPQPIDIPKWAIVQKQNKDHAEWLKEVARQQGL